MRVWEENVHKWSFWASENLHSLIGLKPERWRIKSPCGKSCPARSHLDPPKDLRSTVWTEAIVKLLLCVVEEGIVLQLTRSDLNLRILKVDILAWSRAGLSLIVSAMTNSYVYRAAVSLVTHSTKAAATAMKFFFTHVSLNFWTLGILLINGFRFQILRGQIVQLLIISRSHQFLFAIPLALIV